MGPLKTVALAVGALGVLLLSTGALSGDVWPLASAPAETVVLPVATATQQVGQTLDVCMYHHAPPRAYSVVGSSCRQGAEGCTAFVAIPKVDARNLVPMYDVTNPPVEDLHTGCELPEFKASGNSLPPH